MPRLSLTTRQRNGVFLVRLFMPVASDSATPTGDWFEFNSGRWRCCRVEMASDGDIGGAAPPHRDLVCVTGGSGFIGSWLVRLLLDRGYAVHATVKNLRNMLHLLCAPDHEMERD
jgi:hypothetical protein